MHDYPTHLTALHLLRKQPSWTLCHPMTALWGWLDHLSLSKRVAGITLVKKLGQFLWLSTCRSFTLMQNGGKQLPMAEVQCSGLL